MAETTREERKRWFLECGPDDTWVLRLLADANALEAAEQALAGLCHGLRREYALSEQHPGRGCAPANIRALIAKYGGDHE